jgi:hypothetical protein
VQMASVRIGSDHEFRKFNGMVHTIDSVFGLALWLIPQANERMQSQVSISANLST